MNEPSQPDQEFFSDGDGIFNPDADIFKLADLGIPDMVLDSGTLHIEFFESFDDVADSIDAVWKFGSIYIQVSPTPGALALMGIAGLAGFRRRRRA